MTPAGILFLLRVAFSRRRWRVLSAVLSTAFATATLYTVSALALCLRSEVLPTIARSFPECRLLVRGKSGRLGPLEFGGRIPSSLVERVAAIPGVRFVSPQLPLKVPCWALGRIFGQSLTTDVVVHGVEERLVKRELRENVRFQNPPDASQPLPCMISRFFVDLYNLGIAESNRLPRFSPEEVIGREFTLVLGESSFSEAASRTGERRVCKVAGLTSDPALMAVVLPMESVLEFNRKHRPDGGPPVYSLLHVQVSSIEQVEPVMEAIARLNLEVRNPSETIAGVRFLLTLGIGLLLLLGGGVFLLSLLNFGNTFAFLISERKEQIGLYRALGASRSVVAGLLSAEVLLVGTAGGAIGCGLGVILTSLGNSYGMRWLPATAFLPARLLVAPPGLFLACMTLAAIGGFLASAGAVRSATGFWPAELLRSE